MRATLLGCGQCIYIYDGQGVYCGLITASEVFLIFTTQLYSCLCSCNAIAFIS